MKLLYPLAACLLAAPMAFGQQITNVTTNPSPPHACEQVTYNVMGTGSPGIVFEYLSIVNTETSISIVIQLGGPASGSGSFNKPVGPLGPYAEGTYALTFSLELDGSILSTWTGSLTVLPPDLPNPGTYTTYSVCPNASPFSLLSVMDGSPDPGGAWMDPNSVIMGNDLFVPGVSPAGDYMYYFDMLAPCNMELQFLSITYLENNSAGEDASAYLCTAAGAPGTDLFPLLGGSPDAGGTWSGPGGVSNGIFIPGTSQPGTYTYQVAGIAPCAGTTATVTVTGAPPSNAGTGGEAEFCYNDNAAYLSAYLSGAAVDGVWMDPAGVGIGLFNSPIDVSTYGEGVYYYVVETPPCPADTAFLEVTLLDPPCTVGMVDAHATGGRLQVVPNPASGHVAVEVAGGLSSGQYLELLNMDGKVLQRLASSPTAYHTFDVSALSPGVYVVRISGAGDRAVQRLLVH